MSLSEVIFCIQCRNKFVPVVTTNCVLIALISFIMKFYLLFRKAWVALGKFLEEFVYLAVKICHRDTLPSATQVFKLEKTLKIAKNMRNTTNEQKSRKRPSEQKTKEPTGSEKTSNDGGRKRRREEPPKSAKTNGSSDRKKSRHEEELNSIQEKIESSTNSISLLNNHLEGLMP